jgi:NodT family efflux transporter outer membrane factor (OMF) lipoprotein
MTTPRIRVLAATLAVLLAGCASTAGLAPKAELRDPDTLAATKTFAAVAVQQDTWPAADWWTAFADPQLDALMTEGLAGSPTLALAQARTQKALAFAGIAQSALYPQVNADGAYTRQRFSQNGLVPPPYGGSWSSVNTLQLSLDWEIDFWGKHRATYESAVGQARAAAIDEYAARLALSTAIAHTYVELQRAFDQRDIEVKTLAQREHIFALTRDRNAAGIDSRLEVKQAESALPATRERVAQLDELIGRSRNELAALLGQGPDRGLAIVRPALAPGATVALPSTLPAELLGRRPDIVAQKERIDAARHDIDAARAAFYPNINLAAFVGLSSLGTAGFFSAANRTLGIGPAISLPIFDAGRLRSNLAGRDADYDIAVDGYNQALADGLRDVANQLTAFRSVDTQRYEQVQALGTTQEAYNLALLRYREGLGNYLQVLSAEQPLLLQQALDVDLRARQRAVAIDLVRALGGGYTQDNAALAAATLH